ncbi:MAG: PDZ domain-containing protein [Micromonosporaceae bacterium]
MRPCPPKNRRCWPRCCASCCCLSKALPPASHPPAPSACAWPRAHIPGHRQAAANSSPDPKSPPWPWAAPAAAAGLRRGDVILAISGHHVRSPSSLDRAISLALCAGHATIDILRNSQRHQLTLGPTRYQRSPGLPER